MRTICTGFAWAPGRFAEIGLKWSTLTVGALGPVVRYCFDCGAELEVNLVLVTVYLVVNWGNHAAA